MMKLQALAALFALQGVARGHGLNARHQQLRKRQDAVDTPTTSASSASATSGSDSDFSTLVATLSNVPPLSEITIGRPTGTAWTASTTVDPGHVPTLSSLPDAPAIPGFVYTQADWPAQDQVPPTDSVEVQTWMKELEGFDIPNLAPTTDGSCVSDQAFADDAAARGWWTCGGHTRDTDILVCPDQYTWGVSFDDGPGPYTPKLLEYLDQKDIAATFFIVGSRVIERPDMLIQEHLSGHEISVHTWSHRSLTSLTTEEVVAELGFTRKAVRAVLGMTPTTMRPPFGDIDDRVRAIALAMGLIPIIWTRTEEATFDTNDWSVAAGLEDGVKGVERFVEIMTTAAGLETGFIVLQHDLYESSVDLSIGYNLELALNHVPAFNMQPIGQCSKIPTVDLYRETNTNASFPWATVNSVDIDGGVPITRAAQTPGNGASSAVQGSLPYFFGFAVTLRLLL